MHKRHWLRYQEFKRLEFKEIKGEVNKIMACKKAQDIESKERNLVLPPWLNVFKSWAAREHVAFHSVQHILLFATTKLTHVAGIENNT